MKPDVYIPQPDRPVMPVPYKGWPAWAKMISSRKAEGDSGVGDTAERLFGAVGGEQVKAAFKLAFNMDCGCNYRKDLWNRRYRYD